MLVIEGVKYGLPSKFFEAIGAGVVVVSPGTAVDVNAILGPSALTFDGTPEGLAHALERAWANLTRLRQTQHQALEFFRNSLEREMGLLGSRIRKSTER